MEFSSPCAAMQPPPCPGPWGYRRDLPASRLLFSGTQAFGSDSFNFRDLSMKPNLEYFSFNPVRGSSPAASLAADLSQNFHIDQSPQLATPRRSLFTTNLFQTRDKQEGATTPPIRWEGVTTPPIPSSSPMGGIDPMDMSPLPHKAPFSFVTQLTVNTPTPEPTPHDEDMLSPCAAGPTSAPSFEIPRPSTAFERKRTGPLRPSLMRTKNLSTNTVPLKIREHHNALPPFKFGAGSTAPTSSLSLTLDDCFVPSPPAPERKLLCNQTMGPPKMKTAFSLNRANGSPSAGPIRKPAGPFSRRPSKFRRSLSMYENPADLMKQEKEPYVSTGLQSVMDIEDAPQLKLPHFVPADEPDSLPRITDTTLISVLNGEYKDAYDKTVIVDCRFEYEYEGGHIETAVNFCDKDELEDELFKTPSGNTLLIFHCEYSAHRAPLMAKHIRGRDRDINKDNYPLLTYPEVYILDGGYSSFYESHRTRCFPQNYLKMDAKEHESACERGMNKLRQRTKLSRAQTFAFGQQSCQMEDSPTAHSRSKPGSLLHLGLVSDNSFSSVRLGARRMASY